MKCRLVSLPIAAAAAMVVLAGCTAPASAPAPYAPRAQTFEIPSEDVVELPANSVAAAVDALPAIVERDLEKAGVPGAAVAVVHGDEVLFAQGFGVREVGTDDAVDEQTVFEIASMSKPIGATVVATQVDAGVVTWDTPVAPLLPNFALADPWVTDHVTVGDLYAHRSGLPLAAGDDLEDIGYDRAEVLSRLRDQPLDPFRTTYNYANFGMTAGAEAVAAAADVDWETLSQQALYEPLGMNSTSSRHADYLAHENRALLHAFVDGSFQPLYDRDADAQSPAGGVSSNIDDLATWMSLIIGQGTTDGITLIDDEASLLPAITPQVVSGHPPLVTMRAGSYGFGFNVGSQPSGRTALSHSGAFALGGATAFTIVPELELGIVVLTNGAPIGLPEAVAAEFFDRVQFGDATRDWLADYGVALGHYLAPAGDLVDETPPAAPAASAPLDAFVGTWTNEYFGDAVVSRTGDTLSVALGPDGDYTFELEHWDGDTFAFVPTGENAPEGSRSSAAFTLGGSGGDELTLAFFDGNGLGTWTR